MSSGLTIVMSVAELPKLSAGLSKLITGLVAGVGVSLTEDRISANVGIALRPDGPTT